jgi:hypothetical protein
MTVSVAWWLKLPEVAVIEVCTFRLARPSKRLRAAAWTMSCRPRSQISGKPKLSAASPQVEISHQQIYQCGKKNLVSAEGFEPSTHALKGHCSTN